MKIFVLELTSTALVPLCWTDEEIDAVSMELKKYNIQMPPFQKIGGLLTTNMEGDTAALHAAIIAINQSLFTQVLLLISENYFFKIS